MQRRIDRLQGQLIVTLASRELNPELQMHARGESDAAVRRLHRAGATHVTSPFREGGACTAASILRPAGPVASELEAETTRLGVVALKRAGEITRLVPEDGTRIAPGDCRVVIGARECRAKLALQAHPAGR